jgi:hypothetical protein
MSETVTSGSELKIAAVTAALQLMLQEAVDQRISGTVVQTTHPRELENGDKRNGKINIFLYQVVPNAAWRNAPVSIRQRDPSDPDNRTKETVERLPQVPLNLHYLFSFYGEERTFVPQRLLGVAVQALQAAPQRLPAALADVPKHFDYLAGSGLDFQLQHVERVKLNPLQLNLEELSKLWSVFFQVPYALSLAYEAAAVLIETTARPPIKVVTTPRVQPFDERGPMPSDGPAGVPGGQP